MPSKRKIIRGAFGILLVLCIAPIVYFVTRPPEPVYSGRRLSFWLRMLETNSPILAPAALPPWLRPVKFTPAGWSDLGTNSVPVLIKALEHCDSPTRLAYERFYKGQSKHIPAFVRTRLPYINLERMGENALSLLAAADKTQEKTAIPAMIHVMKADKSSALRQMPFLRQRAAANLKEFIYEDTRVADAFKSVANDGDTSLKVIAAMTLNPPLPYPVPEDRSSHIDTGIK